MFGKVVSGAAWLFFLASLMILMLRLFGFELLVICLLVMILLNSFAEPSKRKG